MKKTLLFLLAGSFFGQSCSSPPETTSSGHPIISLDEAHYLDDPSDLLEKGTFISLKGKNDQGFFRIINKLMITGDTLIVYDNMLAKMVVFDGEGNLLYEIARQGKGPEEYVFINDVFYWEGVNVVDPSTYQIMHYRLDGTWLSTQKFDPYRVGTSIERNEGAYIFYRNSMNYLRPARGYNFASATIDSLHILDSASFISPELASHQYLTANPFAKFNGYIYALPPFEDVIFKMDPKGKIDTAFVIQVPEKDQLAKDPIWLETNVDNFEFKKNIYNNIEAIKNFRTLMILPDKVGFTFTKEKETYFCLYDRKKGTTRFFKTSLLTDDPAISLHLQAVQGEDLFFQVYSREAGKIAEYTGLDLGEDVNAVLLKTRWQK
jgi:hypothetical protein